MVYTPHRGDAPVRHGEGVPLIPDIGPATLDSSVYVDPQRFELERHKVLNRSWQIVCRSSEIPNAGDFLVWEGHGETIIVNRLRSGKVAGFHNVCRHRGARIVPGGCGNARRFTCRWPVTTSEPAPTSTSSPKTARTPCARLCRSSAARRP